MSELFYGTLATPDDMGPFVVSMLCVRTARLRTGNYLLRFVQLIQVELGHLCSCNFVASSEIIKT